MELGDWLDHRQVTKVHASAAPETVPLGWDNENFKLRRSQRLGIAVLGTLLAVLAVVMLNTSDSLVGKLEVVSDAGSTVGNMVRVQRESLVFLIAFEQWTGGTVTRRDLQIRRALLANRLSVRDDEGVINGDRIHTEYFQILGVLDDFMEAGPLGILPHDDRAVIQSKSADAVQSFIFESRKLVEGITRVSDAQTRQLIRNENTRRTNLYVIILALLTLIGLLAVFMEVTRSRDYRIIRTQARDKRQELDETSATLQKVDKDLQLRLEKERIERTEQEWITSGYNSISLRFRSSAESESIAETMVEDLAHVLQADSVISYSFAELPWPRIVKQWHQRPVSQVDESLFTEFESGLFAYIGGLWRDRRVVIVADSGLIKIWPDQIPKIVEATRQLARSWLIVPVGEGTHVVGFLFVGMVESAREWSAAEIELIKRVSATAASTWIQLRMAGQSMQIASMEIAERTAEVSRLVELGKVKSDFIVNMNHELRTPLTSIIGYMEVIVGNVDAGVEPELASSLVAVQRNALRLQILIENMMVIAVSDFKDVPFVVTTVDVGHLLADVVNSMNLVTGDSKVELTLRLDSPAGDLLIDGARNQLEQVFVNLVHNAVKFLPADGGAVTVVARRTHAEGDYVEVKVIDTGIGIPVEDFPNVFKRYFRGSTVIEASIPGFGIGLSLVRLIVLEHHGTITFDSTVGEGTVFTVTLPARYTATDSPIGIR